MVQKTIKVRISCPVRCINWGHPANIVIVNPSIVYGAIHKYVRFRGWVRGTTKSVFLRTGLGGWSQQLRMYAFEKIDYEYVEDKRVVSS